MSSRDGTTSSAIIELLMSKVIMVSMGFTDAMDQAPALRYFHCSILLCTIKRPTAPSTISLSTIQVYINLSIIAVDIIIIPR